MQNCMFNTANILVYRHPVGGSLTTEPVGMMRVGKAQEIPGAFKEGIERILFANGGSATCRAVRMFP